MTELIKLLCGYLKNGTDDQKQMAEEMMLFIAKEKQAVLEPEYFIKYKLGMKMTNPKYDIIEKDGCDLYDEQTVFTGEDILNAPEGLYEFQFKEKTHCRNLHILGAIGQRCINKKHYWLTSWGDFSPAPLELCSDLEKLVLIRKA